MRDHNDNVDRIGEDWRDATTDSIQKRRNSKTRLVVSAEQISRKSAKLVQEGRKEGRKERAFAAHYSQPDPCAIIAARQPGAKDDQGSSG